MRLIFTNKENSNKKKTLSKTIFYKLLKEKKRKPKKSEFKILRLFLFYLLFIKKDNWKLEKKTKK